MWQAVFPGVARKCCLTPRSSGAPTAWRQAREPVLLIIQLAGLAPCRWCPLNSHVRPHMATWSDITIQPEEPALAALRTSWRWMLGDAWTPLLFSAIGDVFFEVPAGTVWWLSTATGSLEQVAESRANFHELLGTDKADEWFLPGLVDALRSSGKTLQPHQCYTYAILPVFAEGSFSAENMHPVAASEHFSLAGHVHESIRQLPDGSSVQVTVHE